MINPSSENEAVRIVAEFDDTAIPLNGAKLEDHADSGNGGVVAANMLNLVTLYSPDPERVARFYTLLGIDFEREQHGSGPEHFAGQIGPQVLEIYPQASNVDASGVRLGLRINSVDAAVQAVRQSGGCIVSAPRSGEWGYRAVLADPDGRRVEIVQRANGESS
jgi:lactoylglutathione lyase